MNDDEKRAACLKDPPPPPEKPRRRKKRRRLGFLIVLLLLLIIAILTLMLINGGFGGGFGSGSGESGEENGGSGSSSSISDIRETSAPETDTAGEQGSAILIEISSEKITLDGEELENAAALKEKLLSINKEGVTYIIRDSRAVKSVYDEAKAVLDELSCSYSEDS